MAFSTLSCPACGGKEVVRKDGRWSCAFCRATFLPHLDPGTLCDDDSSGRACGAPAQTLCKGCARPLCDRHNDPKVYYWREPLHWRGLVPEWKAQDGAEWDRLSQPFQNFPVGDFAPFPWVAHDRNAQYAVGELEMGILEAVKTAARTSGGDADEDAVRFDSVCAGCERETTAGLDAAVSGFRDRYRQAAYVQRLKALHAETRQAVQYVEAFLGRPVSHRALDGPLATLGLDSPARDWDRCGQELEKRLAGLDRLHAVLRPEAT